MKKYIALLMAIILIISLPSCKGNSDDWLGNGTEQNETTLQTSDNHDEPEDTNSAEADPKETEAETKTETEPDAQSEKDPETTIAPKETAFDTKKEETKSPETQKSPTGVSGSGEANIVIDSGNKKPASTTANTTANTTAPKAPETKPADPGYESLKRREPTSYKKVCFAKNGGLNALTLNVPGDWTITKADNNKYTLTYGGITIGSVITGTSVSHSSCEKCSTSSGNGISVQECIVKRAGGYDLRYTFSGRDTNYTLTVDYTQLSDNGAGNIKQTAKSEQLHSDPKIGSAPISHSNDSRNILIAGNSFVGTSRIDDFLYSMLVYGCQNYDAYGSSVGYASVYTYTDDGYFLDSIALGEYAAVIMCGLYSYDDAGRIATLYDHCNKAGTQLIILPAHNENRNVIDYAKSCYPNITFIDWKAEIDMLIKSGISKWEFCIDDAHLHSTPLAGYVGAHMIYRALFGAVPPEIISPDSSTQNQINTYLKKYSVTGYLEYITQNIYYFG